MDPGFGNESGLAAVPPDSDDGEFGRTPGWPFWQMHGCRVVAGWKMDVLRRRNRWRPPSLAPALSGWTAGADDPRPSRGGRHSCRAGRPFPGDFRGNAANRTLGSRRGRRSRAYFRGPGAFVVG